MVDDHSGIPNLRPRCRVVRVEVRLGIMKPVADSLPPCVQEIQRIMGGSQFLREARVLPNPLNGFSEPTQGHFGVVESAVRRHERGTLPFKSDENLNGVGYEYNGNREPEQKLWQRVLQERQSSRMR